jgi:hypothetical protein
MKPRPKLHIVADEPTLEEIREQSAKAGKHVGDAMRSQIAKRDWAAVHVTGDRRAPVFLAACVKRVWRG